MVVTSQLPGSELPASESGLSPLRDGLRRGWCPTGTTPMAAADGWLVRVRPRAGRLDAPALRRLAAICAEHGNGAVILTRRAKLELRGIRDTDAALAALIDAGLVGAEGLPDCIIAPATDLDPTATAHVEPVLQALEAALAEHDASARMPSKFALVLDGGGAAHVHGVAADLRFDATAADHWRVALGGPERDVVVGTCTAAAVPAVACALIERFEQLRTGQESRIWRMRHALDTWGPDRLRAAAEPWLDAPPEHPLPISRASVLGHQPGRWYGVALPCGRLDGATLAGLADISERHGDGDIRILPTRRVLLSRVIAEAAPALRALGGIERPDDARLRAETCSGRGGCVRGTTDTLADTQALVAAAPTLLSAGAGCMLHVSGCAKGCAHSGSAPVTLTGRDGRYDLALHAPPAGEPLWQGLDRQAAAARLAALERVFLRWREGDETAETTLARFDRDGLYERIDEEMTGA